MSPDQASRGGDKSMQSGITILSVATITKRGNARVRVLCKCGYQFVTRRSWVGNRVTACGKCSNTLDAKGNHQ